MKQILSFLTALSKNNNREWFNENKKLYLDALENFRQLVRGMLDGIVQYDPTLANLEAKDSIFRIYKDVRFSKDKSPYKTHFGAWMTKGGRKSTDAGYYFHLESENSFLGAGVYMPPKEQLNLIRQEIVYNPSGYMDLISSPAIIKGYERAGGDDKLKKGPVGFPKDFKYLEEIKYKHYIYSKYYTDADLMKDGFLEMLAADFGGLVPYVNYLNNTMSFTGNE